MTREQKVLIQVLEQVVLVFIYLIWCRSVYLWSSDIGGSYRRGDGSPWPHGTHLRKTTQSASATISHITWTGHGEHFSAYYNQNDLFLKHCSDILLFLSRNFLNSMSSRYVQWLLFVFHLLIVWTHMGVYNTVCCCFLCCRRHIWLVSYGSSPSPPLCREWAWLSVRSERDAWTPIWKELQRSWQACVRKKQVREKISRLLISCVFLVSNQCLIKVFFLTMHISTRGFCRGSGGLHQTGLPGHRAGTQTAGIQTYISQSAEQ